MIAGTAFQKKTLKELLINNIESGSTMKKSHTENPEDTLDDLRDLKVKTWRQNAIFSLTIFIPPVAPQSPSSITGGWYKRAVVATVPSELSLTSLRKRNGSVKTRS